MNSFNTELLQMLLNLFCEYSADTSDLLIPRIVYLWGYKWANRTLPKPTDFHSETERNMAARGVSYAFIRQMEKIDLHAPHTRMKDSVKSLSDKQVEGLAEQWATKLAELEIEQTMATFGMAAREWLLTCELNKIQNLRETDLKILSRVNLTPEQDKMNDVIWRWGNSLAVY